MIAGPRGGSGLDQPDIATERTPREPGGELRRPASSAVAASPRSSAVCAARCKASSAQTSFGSVSTTLRNSFSASGRRFSFRRASAERNCTADIRGDWGEFFAAASRVASAASGRFCSSSIVASSSAAWTARGSAGMLGQFLEEYLGLRRPSEPMESLGAPQPRFVLQHALGRRTLQGGHRRDDLCELPGGLMDRADLEPGAVNPFRAPCCVRSPQDAECPIAVSQSGESPAQAVSGSIRQPAARKGRQGPLVGELRRGEILRARSRHLPGKSRPSRGPDDRLSSQ